MSSSYRYCRWDPDLHDQASDLQSLFKLFNHLLLQTGGNVDEALQWITLHPAWALGIDALTGSLETGKRADVVIWDRHPFSVYSKPVKVWSNGILSFDAETENPVWSDFMTGQEVAR